MNPTAPTKPAQPETAADRLAADQAAKAAADLLLELCNPEPTERSRR